MTEPPKDDLFLDAALVDAFVVESSELLQRMDQDMVALESSPGEAEILNRIFRAMHTIKGTASFLALDPVVRLGHQAEDVLNALRHGEIEATRKVMDALLAARDLLGRMLDDIRSGGLHSYDLTDTLHTLRSLLPEVAPKQPHATTLETLTVPQLRITDTPDEPASGRATQPGDSKVQPSIQPKSEPQKHLAPPPPPTIRVEVRKLDELINLVGELVLERNRLVRIARDVSSGSQSLSDAFASLGQATSRLSFITEELQSAGLRTRMVPIETVFCRFPRLVRDVAAQLNKQVKLVVRGEETELDKSMVELIGDLLVHLVRNSLDHGIEDPETRRKAGKTAAATLRLEARQEGDQIVVSVSDDGRGIDPDKIGKRAVEKGLISMDRLRALSRSEILELIFVPGFSTAEQTSDLSGRGVGMDVVRTNLKRLNGAVEVQSTTGIGTTLLLRFPLTLAILPVLLVQVADETYALPLRSVVETIRLDPAHVHRVEGQEVLSLRGETLSLLRLEQMFRDRRLTPAITTLAAVPDSDSSQKAVILGVAERRFAVIVDGLVGQESTVIKPLGSYLKHCPTLAGATISGDGRVRLVLDPSGLLLPPPAPNSLPASERALA